MMFTPTQTGGAFSGLGLGILLWSFLFKMETIAGLFGLRRFVSRRRTLDWISNNGGLFLAGTAAVNLSLHGTSSPNVVPMTLAMEAFNVVMVVILKTGRLVRRVV